MHPKDKKSNKQLDVRNTQLRGVYLLPNLLTTAALFAGFYAVVAAMRGYFDTAAIAIYVAMLADGLDGRVARMTHTQTAFGAEYDSLSDMVAFGVAPALVVYSWSLFYLGKLGWLAAFIYAAATALRLARFNSQINDNDKNYFQGLPCPTAAGIIASIVWIGANYEVDGIIFGAPVAIVTIVIAALMVSSIRYYSFKSVNFTGRVPFLTAVFIVFIVAAIALQPAELLFILFLLYVISGPVFTLIKLRNMRKQRKSQKE